ncbi:MAG: flavin reductase [Rhizobiaceae bacterium]|nr:flavin reductase [Rhizobiaceae bacterium]
MSDLASTKNDPAEKSPPEIDPRLLRDALGSFATGVTIITAAGDNGLRIGLTANSFSSVSLNPALVSWSLASHAPSMPIFQNCSHYSIHVLRRDQEDLAIRFSQSRDDKFEGVQVIEGVGGAPVLADCLANFQCRNAYRHAGGDHIIFLGAVEKFELGEGAPLIFHRGKFGDIKPQEENT